MELIIITKPELTGLIEESVRNAVLDNSADKDWLSNKEAQEYLGLSRPTLQRYRSSGKLPFSKVGNKIYYRRSDIEALLETHHHS